MNTSPLTQDQINFFREHGYLVIRNLFSKEQTRLIRLWTEEVMKWPVDENVPWMPYDEINVDGVKVLSRTENFANYHEQLGQLLRKGLLISALGQLAGEDMVLFKEKINYKFSGSGGYAAHRDASAYTSIKDINHLTILLAVDRADLENGCLEIVDASHTLDIPDGGDNNLDKSWSAQQDWLAVPLEEGEILVFGSYLVHKSGANHSGKDRKALYATYNCAREGDLHERYYEDRKKTFPATHMMQKDVDYSYGAKIHAFGTPMMSVQAGRQLPV